jgi:hypothetical protein
MTIPIQSLGKTIKKKEEVIQVSLIRVDGSDHLKLGLMEVVLTLVQSLGWLVIWRKMKKFLNYLLHCFPRPFFFFNLVVIHVAAP